MALAKKKNRCETFGAFHYIQGRKKSRISNNIIKLSYSIIPDIVANGITQ